MKTDILAVAEAYEKETGKSRHEWTSKDIHSFTERLRATRQKEGLWSGDKNHSAVREQTADSQ